MHILFVTEKYCAGNAVFGLSNHSHNLFGSLGSTGLATFDALYLDQCQIDKTIFDYLDKSPKVDAIIFGYLGHSNLNPSKNTIELLHKRDIPLIFIFPDTIYSWADDLISEIAPYARLAVCFDTPGIERPANILATIVPQDPRLYHPRAKSIEVSFLGSDYGKRSSYLRYLRQSKLPIKIAGGQHNLPKLTPLQYAEIIGQSKISINFAWGGDNLSLQVKGRVFEIIASNSLLMEIVNSPTQKYLTPGKDYVEFSDEQDLVEAIDYYLYHDKEREEISMNAHQKYLENYTAKHFWETVLSYV